MSELQQIARKLARTWCYVSVHFDKTLPKIGSDADCTVCDNREREILAALERATAVERQACETTALEFTAAPTDPEQVDINDTAEAIAEVIQKRAEPGGAATWVDRLRAERDAALARCCELWGPGTRAHEVAPCEHCAGCLSAINAAAYVWSKDEGEQVVEDSPLGCVACYRGVTMTHADGYVGHNLPAFTQCPVKRAAL